MSDTPTPADQLVTLERQLADTLLRANEIRRHGGDAATEAAQCRALRGRIDALRVVVYAGNGATPVPGTPPDGPTRRPSGLLRKVIEHTNRATEELSRGVSDVPEPIAASSGPDPYGLAAAAIVGHIVDHPHASRARHEAYVRGLLHELFAPLGER